MVKIAIGCDEAACAFRDDIKEMLIEKGYDVKDFGTFNNTPVLCFRRGTSENIVNSNKSV